MSPRTLAAASAIALCSLALAASVAAQPAAKAVAAAPVRNTLPEEERTFMVKAGADGMAEVELGQLAQRKAADRRVRDFARRMVARHGKANDELRALARSKGVSLPSAPDQEQHAHAEKMRDLAGAAFDEAYMEHMVAEHEKAVELFTRISRDAKDPDVKAFATRTLPALREHLRLARAKRR
jgi:putative membrane protein